MKAKAPIEVLDMYKWLPGYGENSISFQLKKRDLILDIFYDAEEDTDEDEKLTIRFSGTCFFRFSSFPGVDLSITEYEGYERLGSLIEYTKSEAAIKWTAHFGFYDQPLRHFQLLFLSDNSMIEVIAEDFTVETHNKKNSL